MSLISAIPAILIAPVSSLTQIEAFCALAPAISASQFSQGQVDQHLVATVEGRVVARCSLWWSAAPLLPGQRVGCIGHYAASDRAAGAKP